MAPECVQNAMPWMFSEGGVCARVENNVLVLYGCTTLLGLLQSQESPDSSEVMLIEKTLF